MTSTTRRMFFQQGLAAGSLLALGGRGRAAVSPNEQVSLGMIGLGWRGGQLVEAFNHQPTARITGICDPDSALVDQWSKSCPQAQTYSDLRKLLDDPGIDAVVIATCNHWHCLAAIWAMEAGKHVYVEKPLSNALWEGQQVVQAAAKLQKICQVGTQQRSSPIQPQIKQLLHEERVLGAIEWVRVNRHGVRGSIGKRSTPLVPPKTVDYNLWLGPAADVPIYRNNLHYDWHWDWNTGAGEMGNWGVHIVDDVRNNVFLDKVAFPRRVVAAGGRYGWHDAGNTPNVHFAVLDTGSIPVVISLSNLPDQPGGKNAAPCPPPGSGYIAYCEGGRLEGERGRARFFDSQGKLLQEFRGGEGMGKHQQDFLDAIRDNAPEKLMAPVEVGHHSSAWCTFADYAYRAGCDSQGLWETSLPKVLSTLQLAKPVKTAAAQMFRDLVKLAGRHETDKSLSRMPLGPLMTFDAEQGAFVGDHAEVANRYVRVPGRGGVGRR
jgi:predicted dehydrogenase